MLLKSAVCLDSNQLTAWNFGHSIQALLKNTLWPTLGTKKTALFCLWNDAVRLLQMILKNHYNALYFWHLKLFGRFVSIDSSSCLESTMPVCFILHNADWKTIFPSKENKLLSIYSLPQKKLKSYTKRYLVSISVCTPPTHGKDRLSVPSFFHPTC